MSGTRVRNEWWVNRLLLWMREEGIRSTSLSPTFLSFIWTIFSWITDNYHWWQLAVCHRRTSCEKVWMKQNRTSQFCISSNSASTQKSGRDLIRSAWCKWFCGTLWSWSCHQRKNCSFVLKQSIHLLPSWCTWCILGAHKAHFPTKQPRPALFAWSDHREWEPQLQVPGWPSSLPGDHLLSGLLSCWSRTLHPQPRGSWATGLKRKPLIIIIIIIRLKSTTDQHTFWWIYASSWIIERRRNLLKIR